MQETKDAYLIFLNWSSFKSINPHLHEFHSLAVVETGLEIDLEGS